MLPWGDPPGTSLGWERVVPILTDMVLPLRKACTNPIVESVAPMLRMALMHDVWHIRLKAFSKSMLRTETADLWSSRGSIIDCNLEEIMQNKGIETLSERREKNILKFALKNENNEKYGKRWFASHLITGREVRSTTRDKYRLP